MIPPSLPGLNSLLALAVGVVIVAALYFAREVLVPITLAVLLSFVLAPLVALLRRIHVPQALSVLAAVIIGLGVIGGLGAVIGMQVAALASDVPKYASTIETKVQTVQSFAFNRITDLTHRFGHPLQSAMAPAPSTAAAPENGEVQQPKPVPVEIRQPASDPLVIARSVLEPILAPLESAVIIFIVAVFILLQKEDVRDRLIRLFGSNDLHRTTTAMDDAAQRLSRYFLAQLGINTIFGVVIGIGLAVIGVPSALLWGILGAILRFVPYVGPVIAAILPATLAAAVSPNWTMVIWTVGLFAVVEGFTGQVMEPVIYGKSTGLSPLAVVVAAIFWSWIWGPIGLVLSTPLTLCLVVLGRYVDSLEFLEVMFGDRPALTPIENFYQRMLADDPDEALQQAEVLLKERSLTAYYEEVALKGLQLAANDAHRGVLTTDRLERIEGSVQSLVDDLDSHDDRDPTSDEIAEVANVTSKAEKEIPKTNAPEATAPAAEQLVGAWKDKAPVLCLAGRGPLDGATASILLQLLRKHGLGGRTEPYSSASRTGIATLDREGVAVICITHLEIRGNPASLQYLIRRLRFRMPGVPIVVGLWPADDAVLKDDHVRASIGADYYTTSLSDSVEICIKLAHQDTKISGAQAA